MNGLVRRVSALPFVKPSDLDEAFDIFKKRAGDLDEDLEEFSVGLIEYAQTQWRQRFSIQDWNLFAINCLIVPSTNNGNEGANGRFLMDFGVHPTFWSFIISASEELERVEKDIPSILYGSLIPAQSALYNSLKEERERVRANFEAGLIDLDGMMGKLGAIRLATGKAKVATDDNETDAIPTRKRKPNDGAKENSAPKKKRAGRGRPPLNTGKSSGEKPHEEDQLPVHHDQLPVNDPPLESFPMSSGNLFIADAAGPQSEPLPFPPMRGLQPISATLPLSFFTSVNTS